MTLTSGYDAMHDLTSVVDNISGNIGTTTYAYDLGERLTTITTSYGGTSGPQVVTSYAANNQISAQSRTIGGSGTAVNTSFSYDSDDRQTTITDYVSGGSALATYVYSYDNANRVTTMVDAEGTYTYTYDNANELTSVYKGGTQVESYSYDSNGNRTGTGYSTTVMNETANSPGPVSYTYDSAGNMITSNSGGTITTYTYDYRGQLTGVEQGGTMIATYTYNALDQRIGIADSGGGQIWTVYNGTSADALPYADFNGSGKLLTRYVSGPGMVNGAVVDELLARASSGGTTAWYLTDKLDSVRDVVSAAGTLLDHIVYDSYGNILTQTNGSSGDRFAFAGMEYDSSTGQYYDRARSYDPRIGAFTILDPLGFAAKTANLYRYVGNNATNWTDPTGLNAEFDKQDFPKNPFGPLDPEKYPGPSIPANERQQIEDLRMATIRALEEIQAEKLANVQAESRAILRLAISALKIQYTISENYLNSLNSSEIWAMRATVDNKRFVMYLCMQILQLKAQAQFEAIYHEMWHNIKRQTQLGYTQQEEHDADEFAYWVFKEVQKTQAYRTYMQKYYPQQNAGGAGQR